MARRRESPATLEDVLEALERLESKVAVFKEVLTLEEAAAYMGRSRRYLYDHLDEIPHGRSELGVYFRRTELNRHMMRRTKRTE